MPLSTAACCFQLLTDFLVKWTKKTTKKVIYFPFEELELNEEPIEGASTRRANCPPPPPVARGTQTLCLCSFTLNCISKTFEKQPFLIETMYKKGKVLSLHFQGKGIHCRKSRCRRPETVTEVFETFIRQSFLMAALIMYLKSKIQWWSCRDAALSDRRTTDIHRLLFLEQNLCCADMRCLSLTLYIHSPLPSFPSHSQRGSPPPSEGGTRDFSRRSVAANQTGVNVEAEEEKLL